MPIKRIIVYIAGLIILALGIDLNTKTMLGISPIISVPYNISVISGWLLGAVIFSYYVLLVILQLLIQKKDFPVYQFLQIPCAFVTSAAVQIFDNVIPVPGHIALKIIVLILAIVVTAIGASLVVGMKIVPNPADGLANIIGTKLGHGFGFGKNIIDFISITVSIIIGLVAKGSIIGIGIGTVITMIMTGRVIALLQNTIDSIYGWASK
ncbi:MAG: hypothetical protein IIT48_10640 [Lachnospiraceae bacterium]|nr:hypothetical protein [Lachnospiraceae bacterium]